MRTGKASLVAIGLSIAMLGGCTGTEAPEPESGTSAQHSASAGSSSAATSIAPSAGGQGQLNPPKVCGGQTAADVVSRVEPSVVTVRTEKGLGSGVVYKPHMILTVHHVVAREEGRQPVFDEVEVSLADGSRITGRVIGGDLLTDLAVIQVDRELAPLKFRDTLPRPGQSVMALGSPLGFRTSVTRGIVSALGRDLPSGESTDRPLVNLIQTDAPISPGNSGGALVDMCGHVVGINEAYIPPKSGAVALGFATPAVVATRIADEIIANGSATHPYLGIGLRNLTPQIARALGVDVSAGVVVIEVVPDSPAGQAGFQRGDVITAFNGQDIEDYADLLGALRQAEIGSTVAVTVHRQGEAKTLQVTIGSRR